MDKYLELFNDIIENYELYDLLRQNKAPSINSVINARNTIIDDGRNFNKNIFSNIIELAARSEAHYSSEYCSYPVIEDHLKKDKLSVKILGGANQPDLLVNHKVPVEVKTNSFNAAALRQLERYMRKYGSKNGIAVGAYPSVNIPENIRFIQIAFNSDEMCYEIVGV